MGIARDIIDQAQTLMSQRSDLERTWENICRMLFLSPDRQFRRGQLSNMQNFDSWNTASKVADKARFIYDITGVVALERMVAGVTSLITPDNEKWQSIKINDPFGHEMTDEEEKWGERLRDYKFNVRYDPRSGWALANQAAIASAAALGTGAYIIEENLGRYNINPRDVPWMCTNLPLSDNFFTVNGQGFHDQDFRIITDTARNFAGRFGNMISDKLMTLANDPKRCHQQVQVLHYVGERSEYGPKYSLNPGSRVASCYIEMETQHEIRHGGFTYWPIIVYNWKQMTSSAYGESAAMLVMAEVASANVLAKNALLASQQHTRPPIATMDDSTMNRPNLNPGAINYGALDNKGNLKMKPILTTANPQLSEIILESSRKQINLGLYTNLWQILMSDPNKTATQSLIEANEKGELLGPIGTRIQAGLGRLDDAENDILQGKGAFAPGAALEAPESVYKRSIGPKYASPLDRLRRSNELLGMRQTVEMTGMLAQFDESVADNIDSEEVQKLTREISGAPARIMRSPEEVQKLREERAMKQQVAAAPALAKAGKDAAQGAAAVAPQQDNIAALLQKFGIGGGAGGVAADPSAAVPA